MVAGVQRVVASVGPLVVAADQLDVNHFPLGNRELEHAPVTERRRRRRRLGPGERRALPRTPMVPRSLG